MQFKSASVQPRLTTRYKRLATIVGVVFVLISVIASGYVASIKSSSSARLLELTKIKQLSSQIRYLVDDAQLKLNNLLMSSSPEVTNTPLKPLQQGIEYANELQQLAASLNNGFAQNLPALGARPAVLSIVAD